MSDKKRFHKPGSLQPNIEDILQWNDLPADAFEPATSEEKENFIQDRRSVSYWKDAWRRLRKNTVAMVALVIIILLAIFAFVGPAVVPYTIQTADPWLRSFTSMALQPGRSGKDQCLHGRAQWCR